MKMKELVAGVESHANRHYYNGEGWDILSALWDEEDISRAIGTAQDLEDAIANCKFELNASMMERGG